MEKWSYNLTKITQCFERLHSVLKENSDYAFMTVGQILLHKVIIKCEILMITIYFANKRKLLASKSSLGLEVTIYYIYCSYSLFF